jgi:hypothetical protein
MSRYFGGGYSFRGRRRERIPGPLLKVIVRRRRGVDTRIWLVMELSIEHYRCCLAANLHTP